MPARLPPRPIPPEVWAVALAHEDWVLGVARTKRLTGRGLDDDDLRQEGLVGLCRAAELYRPERGEWKPYACAWIRDALQRAVARGGSAVRRPVRSLKAGEGHETRPLDHIGDALPAREDRVDPGTWADVLAAVDALPDPRRAAVRLRFGLDAGPEGPLLIREVGAAIGVSHAGARYHLDAALDQLRSLLDPG